MIREYKYNNKELDLKLNKLKILLYFLRFLIYYYFSWIIKNWINFFFSFNICHVEFVSPSPRGYKNFLPPGEEFKFCQLQICQKKIFFLRKIAWESILYPKILTYTFLSKFVKLTYTKMSNCQRQSIDKKIYCQKI